jgi:predicted PurR-regulated permease PerM
VPAQGARVAKEKYFFVICICAAFLGVVFLLYPYLNYLFFAVLLAYLLHPLRRLLQKKIKNRSVGALTLIFLILVVVILPTIFISTRLVQEVRSTVSFVTDSPQRDTYLEKVENLLRGWIGQEASLQAYKDQLTEAMKSFLVRSVPNFLGSLSDVTVGLFIMFFVLFYLFRESQEPYERLQALIPLAPNLKDKLIEEVKSVTWAVVYGQVMTALIQGTLGGLGFLIFRAPNPFLWGFMMIIFSFLPLVGTALIWVPAGIFLILSGATFRGIGLLVWGSVLVTNVDNFVKPRLISGRSNIHPVTVLLGVLGGLKLFGFIGLVVGPLILALFIALVHFYEEEYLGIKGQDQENRSSQM